MNRDEQEMALWRRTYGRWYSRAQYNVAECSEIADAAVAEFRKRYPPQPNGNSDSDTAPILSLLKAIAGDSAFTGFSDSMQSRIYAATDALRRGQAAAPKAVWYDEPPFAGEYHVEGLPCVCWVDEDVVWCPTWDREGERPRLVEVSLAGRRVSHVTKPPEPKT